VETLRCKTPIVIVLLFILFLSPHYTEVKQMFLVQSLKGSLCWDVRCS